MAKGEYIPVSQRVPVYITELFNRYSKNHPRYTTFEIKMTKKPFFSFKKGDMVYCSTEVCGYKIVEDPSLYNKGHYFHVISSKEIIMHKKWVIEDNILKMRDNTTHQELVADPTKVIGGGMWYYDQKNDNLIFYGDSEYGQVTEKEFYECDRSAADWIIRNCTSCKITFTLNLEI